MTGAFGRPQPAYGVSPERACARLQTRYQKLLSKGRGPKKLAKVKKRLDAQCGRAAQVQQAQSVPFTQAYEAEQETVALQEAQQDVTQTAQTAGSRPVLPLLLIGGAGILALVLILGSGAKAEPQRRMAAA